LWEIVGDCGEENQVEVIMDRRKAKAATVLESPSDTSIQQRILIFCTRHPKMKFTLECILNHNEEEKAAMDKELRDLVDDGILEKQISDVGTVWYYVLN
jgi:predicted HTH transcriptional regulator